MHPLKSRQFQAVFWHNKTAWSWSPLDVRIRVGYGTKRVAKPPDPWYGLAWHTKRLNWVVDSSIANTHMLQGVRKIAFGMPTRALYAASIVAILCIHMPFSGNRYVNLKIDRAGSNRWALPWRSIFVNSVHRYLFCCVFLVLVKHGAQHDVTTYI